MNTHFLPSIDGWVTSFFEDEAEILPAKLTEHQNKENDEPNKRSPRREGNPANMARREDRQKFQPNHAYVCNHRQPSLEQLFEIAKILGVNVKELIDSKENE